MAARAVAVERVLTARQQEFIALTWRGLSNREIGRLHGVGERTVRRELWRAHHRLGIAGRGQTRVLTATWLWRACARRLGQPHKGGVPSTSSHAKNGTAWRC